MTTKTLNLHFKGALLRLTNNHVTAFRHIYED